MGRYLQSRWIQAGLTLLVVGAGPLIFIIVAAAIGLWPDPNPNPIGPGLLFFFTFWPAVLCIIVGVVRIRFFGATPQPAVKEKTAPPAGEVLPRGPQGPG